MATYPSRNDVVGDSVSHMWHFSISIFLSWHSAEAKGRTDICDVENEASLFTFAAPPPRSIHLTVNTLPLQLLNHSYKAALNSILIELSLVFNSTSPLEELLPIPPS